MADILEQSAQDYCRLISHLAPSWPGHEALHDFVNVTKHSSVCPAKITVVTINSSSVRMDVSPTIEFTDIEDINDLANSLGSIPKDDSCSRLYVVENVCPRAIALLGGCFNIDTQFFADHVNNLSWYRIDNVSKRIPALPSSEKLHDFLQLRYLDFRPIDKNKSPNPIGSSSRIKTGISRTWTDIDPTSDAITYPDNTTTRIVRKAAKLIPTKREGKSFNTLLCTRNVITAWFQKKTLGIGGWTGILLLDPPFQLPQGEFYCRRSEFRNFMARPSLNDPPTEAVYSHKSIREAFLYHLQTKFRKNPELLEIAAEDSFFMLSDVYRLVASSWMVVVEYLNREFSTIEHVLEKQEAGIRDLESHLKSLYVYRRRCLMYYKLISEAKEQCQKRGKQSWHKHSTSDVAIENASDLRGDFAFLQLKMQDTGLRTEKNINLLMGLVAIGENKQGIVENHAVARITLFAMIFLPFSTVATILGMPGNFAPGSDCFWVFWAIVLPLTALIIGSFALYDGFRRHMLNKMSSPSSDRRSRSSSESRELHSKQGFDTTKDRLLSATGWLTKSWQDKSCTTIQESQELEAVSSTV